jgi:hypothetical protein
LKLNVALEAGLEAHPFDGNARALSVSPVLMLRGDEYNVDDTVGSVPSKVIRMDDGGPATDRVTVCVDE